MFIKKQLIACRVDIIMGLKKKTAENDYMSNESNGEME